MEYLNIPANAFRSPEFIGADPVQRGTWIALMGWCASQENGGRIPNCRGWKDRMWQQLVGVTAEEVMQDCDLWQWDGDDLQLVFYPVEQEQALRLKRDGLAAGGKSTSEAKSIAARENGRNGGRPRKNPTQTQLETQAPPPETQLEPNVKEGKEKESKGREEARADARPTPPPLSPVNLLPVDRVRAELATVFPSAPRHMTAGEQHDLFGSLSVLDELTAEDWQACRGWVTCPDRVRGRKLWPRDRAEFVANAGQAVESIRQWWKTDGRSWWNRSQGNPPRKTTPGTSTTAPVGDVIEDPAEALAFFRSAPAKPAPQSVAVA